jgi:hypothetical protein
MHVTNVSSTYMHVYPNMPGVGTGTKVISILAVVMHMCYKWNISVKLDVLIVGLNFLYNYDTVQDFEILGL